MPGNVVVVDDERNMRELLEADLTLRGFQVQSFASASEAWSNLSEEVDVVVTDIRMPGTTGLTLCERIHREMPDLPVIVMTGFGSLETAVAALRAGAYDFVTKPIEMDLLAAALERAVKQRQLQRRVLQLAAVVDHSSAFGDIVGESPAMQRVYAQLVQLAPTDTSLLLTGESGTGKELVARAIHRRSRRSSAPFVAVNCGAIPENLLESELFGHTKGAFTDARSERKGVFLQADGGTLFLDEIGELPLSMQVKLLRVLEQRTVRPVGGDREVPFDVRLVSATNRDLEEAVHAQHFREDLFYRINVVQIELPPLRARGSDVLTLAQHFLDFYANKLGRRALRLSPAVAEKLLAYHWPGNVRELRNVMERAVALAQHDEMTLSDLPDKIRDYRSSQWVLHGEDVNELVTLEELQRRYMEHVLKVTGGNQTQAARILGVDRKTLYRKSRSSDGN